MIWLTMYLALGLGMMLGYWLIDQPGFRRSTVVWSLIILLAWPLVALAAVST